MGAQGFDPSTFTDFGDILGDLFGFGDLFGGAGRRGAADATARNAARICAMTWKCRSKTPFAG